MGEPILRLDAVSKTFAGPPEVHALRNATFVLYDAQITAVVGPSGSGKTTLLNILGMLDTPTAGRYQIRGVDASALPEQRRTEMRASLLGFVFQAFHLVPYLDCVQNVMLPLVHKGAPRRTRLARAREALTSVGLDHRWDAYPTTLSGGEQQRVAIARAIVHEPAIVLCDEPTGNLDSENTSNVLELLKHIATPERAVVVITHDAGVAGVADRILRVVDGVVHGAE